MSLNLVPAVASDVLDIVRLVQSVYRGDSSLKGWTSEAHFLDGQRVDVVMAQEMIHKMDSTIFLYRQGSKLLACVHLEKVGSKAHLGMLSVSTEFQGQNIGQQIITFCELFASTQWGALELQIEVLQQRQELIAWYERRGFYKTGKTLPFPQNPQFGIPKVKDLYFLEMIKELPSKI